MYLTAAAQRDPHLPLIIPLQKHLPDLEYAEDFCRLPDFDQDGQGYSLVMSCHAKRRWLMVLILLGQVHQR